LETLAAEPYNGRADLPPLAAELQMEIDDLFPVLETLQLLRFAEVAEGDVRLTEAGMRFARADLDEGKRLFAQHLIAYVPLAAHIKRVLDERASHRAPPAHHARQRERDAITRVMAADRNCDALVADDGLGNARGHHPDPVLAGVIAFDDRDIGIAHFALDPAAKLRGLQAAPLEFLQHPRPSDAGGGPQEHLRGAMFAEDLGLDAGRIDAEMPGQVHAKT